MPTPEKAVKNFIKQMNKGKVSKAFEYVDFVGMGVFDSDNLDDFVEDYKDAKEDYEEDQDEIDEALEERIEEMEEGIGEYEQFSMELKSIKKAKKVKSAKNLYKVKAKVKVVVKEEDSSANRNTNDVTFYVYKTGGKYKIVGMEGGSLMNF
jgi:cell division septum initiation protein DivIVA